ncbi:hypothetical protein [Polynucleobacter sp. MWH-HuK1]|uniref:hypothetical protein n=1 Tax=Polynucleobacter sp. MWH-HuK1 TaxID=1743158 RepID=UPI001C0BE8BC|nr:hypothetical protein [Polynucleobacter sp. MWH-HuK1]MBU3564825.1 hypothetical protein [Polynucleobacter sp. MWH-HuK1]
MRKICIALCLSLFASLIHAVGMPTSNDGLDQLHFQHVIQHDCHTQADTKIDKTHQSTNHQAHHQCCLGVVANLSSNQYRQPDFSSHFVPHVPQLIVEAIPSHIFKPPRFIS